MSGIHYLYWIQSSIHHAKTVLPTVLGLFLKDASIILIQTFM